MVDLNVSTVLSHHGEYLLPLWKYSQTFNSLHQGIVLCTRNFRFSRAANCYVELYVDLNLKDEVWDEAEILFFKLLLGVNNKRNLRDVLGFELSKGNRKFLIQLLYIRGIMRQMASWFYLTLKVNPFISQSSHS